MICARQAHDHLTGVRRSHELASLGRRICEPEWDFLELREVVMQDRPTAAELLDSVAEYLFAELRPEVPREQRFKVLVAANVCAVVAREIGAGEEPDRRGPGAVRRAARRARSTMFAPPPPSSRDGCAQASSMTGSRSWRRGSRSTSGASSRSPGPATTRARGRWGGLPPRPASRLLVEGAEQLHGLLGVRAGVGVPGLGPELLVERLADRVQDRLLR